MKVSNYSDSTTFGYRVKYYSPKDVQHAADIMRVSPELRQEFKSVAELAKKAVGLKEFNKFKKEQPELAAAFDSAKDRFARETENSGLKGDIYITGFDFVNSMYGKVSSFSVSISSSNAKNVQGLPIHMLIDGHGIPQKSDDYMRSFETKQELFKLLNGTDAKAKESGFKALSNNIYKALLSLNYEGKTLKVPSSVVAKDASPAYVRAIAEQEHQINTSVENAENHHDSAQKLYEKLFNRSYFEKIGEPIAPPTGKGVKNNQKYKMIAHQDAYKNYFPYSLDADVDLAELLAQAKKSLKPSPYKVMTASPTDIVKANNKKDIDVEAALGVKQYAEPGVFKAVDAILDVLLKPVKGAKSKRVKTSSADKPKLTRAEVLAQMKAEKKAQKKAVVAAAKANKPLHPNNTQILSKKHRQAVQLNYAV